MATWEHIVNDASIRTRENIARCWASCNSSKGTRKLSQWIESPYCKRRGIGPETVADIVKHALKGMAPNGAECVRLRELDHEIEQLNAIWMRSGKRRPGDTLPRSELVAPERGRSNDRLRRRYHSGRPVWRIHEDRHRQTHRG